MWTNQKTRPGTRQDSRGQFGRSSNVKTACNSKIFRTDGPTDRLTRQGVESHVRVKNKNIQYIIVSFHLQFQTIERERLSFWAIVRMKAKGKD